MIPEKMPETKLSRFLNHFGLGRRTEQEENKVRETTQNRFHSTSQDSTDLADREVSRGGIAELTPAAKIELLVFALKEVNDLAKTLDLDHSVNNDVLENLRVFCENLETTIPQATKQTLSALRDLKIQYAKERAFEYAPALKEQQEILESSLADAFSLFSKIRKSLHDHLDELDEGSQHTFASVHSLLSKALEQSTDDLNEGIELPTIPSGFLSKVKMVLSHQECRGKIPEAIRYIFTGVGSTIKAVWGRYILRDATVEGPTNEINKTKAKVANCFVSFLNVFSDLPKDQLVKFATTMDPESKPIKTLLPLLLEKLSMEELQGALSKWNEGNRPLQKIITKEVIGSLTKAQCLRLSAGVATMFFRPLETLDNLQYELKNAFPSYARRHIEDLHGWGIEPSTHIRRILYMNDINIEERDAAIAYRINFLKFDRRDGRQRLHNCLKLSV